MLVQFSHATDWLSHYSLSINRGTRTLKSLHFVGPKQLTQEHRKNWMEAALIFWSLYKLATKHYKQTEWTEHVWKCLVVSTAKCTTQNECERCECFPFVVGKPEMCKGNEHPVSVQREPLFDLFEAFRVFGVYRSSLWMLEMIVFTLLLWPFTRKMLEVSSSPSAPARFFLTGVVSPLLQVLANER